MGRELRQKLPGLLSDEMRAAVDPSGRGTVIRSDYILTSADINLGSRATCRGFWCLRWYPSRADHRGYRSDDLEPSPTA